MNHTFEALKPLAAVACRATAGLILAGLASSASAAMFTFEGLVDDFAPLAGSHLSGSFAYTSPSELGPVEVPLSDFTLNFLGQTYSLTSPNAAGWAWTTDGVFAGFEYVLSADEQHPDISISLLSGFFSGPSEGQFGFTVNPLDETRAQVSWGSFAVTPLQVPEPGMFGLLLASGVAAVCVARPRRKD